MEVDLVESNRRPFLPWIVINLDYDVVGEAFLPVGQNGQGWDRYQTGVVCRPGRENLRVKGNREQRKNQYSVTRDLSAGRYGLFSSSTAESPAL